MAYEFGQAGGRFVIQRITKTASKVVVERTLPMRLDEAERLWLALCEGAAQ
ncbi:hypothetical protein [Streptosporangium sp. NPDC020145]|uniref:hypothetical protein n=1 Tax=Streptosporangium sp. NPDC020145 TaxID=3154694 RepID=UPI003415B677